MDQDQKGHDLSGTVSTSSVKSVKSKKSGSIISAFIRRAKKSKTKSKSDQTMENLQTAVMKFNYEICSNSSAGCGRDEENNEIELNVQNYDQRESALLNVIELDGTDDECKTTTSTYVAEHPKSASILNKAMENLPISEPDCRKFRTTEGVAMEDIELSTEDLNEVTHYEQFTQSSNKDFSSGEYAAPIDSNWPTTIIHFPKPALDANLADGIHYIQDVCTNLIDSEAYLIQLIKKYIKDDSFQTELLETITHHSKVQWDAERRANALANDMWVQQSEINRVQERTLQESMNSIVRQNRQLQLEYENLSRQHEKLLSKSRLYPEWNGRARPLDGNNSIVTKLSKNNERLHGMVAGYMQQNDLLEKEVKVCQKQNESLEHYVRNLQTQTQNLKAILQRKKTEFELEQASLTHQLHTVENLIKDSIDAGDYLLEDLDRQKRQMKELPVTINWTKFKCRGSCLNDLIHVCRSCINELSRELIAAHNTIVLKDKDVENLRETNSRLQENLCKSTIELDNLSKKADEVAIRCSEKAVLEEKFKQLEVTIGKLRESLEQKCQEFEAEKASLMKTIEEKENMENEISERNKLVEEKERIISTMTSENYCLKTQIEGLKKVLSDSGAGDMAKELSQSHEKISQFQAQYYQLAAEKNILMEQLNQLNNEKSNLTRYYEIYYQQMQKQLGDLETLSQENVTLKTQLEKERLTLIAINSERNQYLEEKKSLRSIFYRLNAEISKYQKLEGKVASISEQSKRMAMIAEYNKQMGEKLKIEVEERDNKITELTANVQKLNNEHMESTKDKLTLCAELSEICSIKDKLNDTLAIEMQKNIALEEARKEIEHTTTSQLKLFEEIQRNERATMKELLKDYKNVVQQRDNLLEANKRHQKEILELKSHCINQLKRCDSISSENCEKEMLLKQMGSKLQEDASVIKELEEKITADEEKYECNLKKVEKVLRQVRKEKEDTEKSVAYLKNNVQKLHSDLDEARRSAKEGQDNCKLLANKNISLGDEVRQYKEIIQAGKTEREQLISEVRRLDDLCREALAELQDCIFAAAEKEKALKKNMDDGTQLGQLSSDAELKTTRENLEKLTEQYRIAERKIREYEEMEVKLAENIRAKERLGQQLHEQKLQNKECEMQIRRLTRDVHSLTSELEHLKEDREMNVHNFKDQVNSLTRSFEERKESLTRDLNKAKTELAALTNTYESEKGQHENLVNVHKEVTTKLLNTVKLLVDEKNASKEISEQLLLQREELQRLRAEKSKLREQNEMLQSSLSEAQNKASKLLSEKETAHRKLEETQMVHGQLSKKYSILEHELRDEKDRLARVMGTFHHTDKDGEKTLVDVHLYDEALNQLQAAEDRVARLRSELDESHEQCLQLKAELGKIQHQLVTLEFQKCEVTLRLHEAQTKMEVEHGLYLSAKEEQQQLLAAIMRLKDEGKVALSDCTGLLEQIHQRSTELVNINITSSSEVSSRLTRSMNE